jgi:hypothetical protein
MNSDFKDLLRILLENKAQFLVVGGYAVIRYTEPRYTKDLDILIGSQQENASKVYRALQEFGAPLATLLVEDLTVEGNFFQIGLPPSRVDIIVQIPGVNFPQAYARADFCMIGSLSVPFISCEDLIQAKLAAGRPQDLVDAGALTKSKLAR